MRDQKSAAFGVRGTLAAGEGFRIDHVEPNSPAERRGLERGDVVLNIGGYPAGHAEAYRLLTDGYSTELPLTLVVRDGRGGQPRKLLPDGKSVAVSSPSFRQRCLTALLRSLAPWTT
jgi:S1-C subfamily serine protease